MSDQLSDAEIIRSIDHIEAQLRSIEHHLFRLRSSLRVRVDPWKRRKDLGYWPDEDGDGLRPALAKADGQR